MIPLVEHEPTPPADWEGWEWRVWAIDRGTVYRALAGISVVLEPLGADR